MEHQLINESPGQICESDPAHLHASCYCGVRYTFFDLCDHVLSGLLSHDGGRDPRPARRRRLAAAGTGLMTLGWVKRRPEVFGGGRFFQFCFVSLGWLLGFCGVFRGLLCCFVVRFVGFLAPRFLSFWLLGFLVGFLVFWLLGILACRALSSLV